VKIDPRDLLEGATFAPRAKEIVRPLSAPQLGSLLREIFEEIQRRLALEGEPPITTHALMLSLADELVEWETKA
jgi:hypothetical protein